jgi:AcrR family transcriptional regulator
MYAARAMMTSAAGVDTAAPRPGTRTARRTQAERRARTRHALLAATIETLVDAGFAGVTTRAVANRAGMSIGALQHHFESKAELVAGAIEHLTAELTRELLVQTPTAGRSERELAEELLDRLWELHRGPLMAAVAELAVAARTDAELRDRLTRVQREAIAASAPAVDQMFPGAAGLALQALLHTTLATLRGLALLGFVDPPAAEAMWAATRSHLLTLLFARPPERRRR